MFHPFVPAGRGQRRLCEATACVQVSDVAGAARTVQKKAFQRHYCQHKGVTGGSAMEDAAEVPSG